MINLPLKKPNPVATSPTLQSAAVVFGGHLSARSRLTGDNLPLSGASNVSDQAMCIIVEFKN